MDNTPQTTAQQPTNEDQELAAALASVLPGAGDPGLSTVAPQSQSDPAPQTEEVPAPAPAENVEAPAQPADAPVEVDTNIAPVPSIDLSSVNTPEKPTQTSSPATAGDDLESIKKNALGELRPLIDKVDLPAEEKFDTYLMLIRSTDDKDLIAPAHAVALTIADESKKAEALLDIIKEIDYLSRTEQK